MYVHIDHVTTYIASNAYRVPMTVNANVNTENVHVFVVSPAISHPVMNLARQSSRVDMTACMGLCGEECPHVCQIIM